MHYGHPMTGVELGRIYYDGRVPDVAYWERVDASLTQYDQEREKAAFDCDYTFVWMPFFRRNSMTSDEQAS